MSQPSNQRGEVIEGLTLLLFYPQSLPTSKLLAQNKAMGSLRQSSGQLLPPTWLPLDSVLCVPS